MVRNSLVLAVLLLSGCATALTPGGRGVKVVHVGDGTPVATCERLGLAVAVGREARDAGRP